VREWVKQVVKTMTKLNLGTLVLLATCVAAFGTAGAQTMHHDRMDARAAKADIMRLKADRRNAVRTRNWGKVKQDDRLIAADKHFVRKDIRNGG